MGTEVAGEPGESQQACLKMLWPRTVGSSRLGAEGERRAALMERERLPAAPNTPKRAE